MAKQNASQRALKIWQLCANCQYLEQDLPECNHIRAVERNCERYACITQGIQLEVHSIVNEETIQIEHVKDELERPQSALLKGHTREQLVEIIMKVIKFAG